MRSQGHPPLRLTTISTTTTLRAAFHYAGQIARQFTTTIPISIGDGSTRTRTHRQKKKKKGLGNLSFPSPTHWAALACDAHPLSPFLSSACRFRAHLLGGGGVVDGVKSFFFWGEGFLFISTQSNTMNQFRKQRMNLFSKGGGGVM